jgi:hypothetical protein
MGQNNKPTGPLPKLKPNMPLDYWKMRFQNSNPDQYRQFKNKTPEKKDQMAVSARYAANDPSKK